MLSNPEIEKIYSIAVQAGAFSGKVSGAGGGGFMFFMIQPEKKYQLIVNCCLKCTHLQLSIAVNPKIIYKKYPNSTKQKR